MKKVLTLFVSLIMVAVSFAQYGPGNQDNYDRSNNDRYKKHRNHNPNDRYSFRERDMQIEQINREYDRKIESVRNRWFMNHSKKRRMIAALEHQRKMEIRKVYERYNDRHDKHDRYDRNDRKDW